MCQPRLQPGPAPRYRPAVQAPHHTMTLAGGPRRTEPVMLISTALTILAVMIGIPVFLLLLVALAASAEAVRDRREQRAVRAQRDAQSRRNRDVKVAADNVTLDAEAFAALMGEQP